jgi:hypothetical protein
VLRREIVEELRAVPAEQQTNRGSKP